MPSATNPAAPPASMVSLIGLREVVQFAVNVTVTANATQVLVGSAATAIGPVPGRAMHLKRVQCSGHCAAAANTPELNIGVFKNFIPTGLPTPNTTNRAMIAKALVTNGAGATFLSEAVVDADMDAFNGLADFWTVGAWATGATGTCSMSTFHVRLEFTID